MAVVFRKESLERAASPERLDDYIKVSNPGMWMVLGAVVLLAAGLLVWACFGNLSDVRQGVLVVDGQSSVCYVDQSAEPFLSAGDPVSVGDAQGSLSGASGEALPTSALMGEAAQAAADLPEGTGWLCSAAASIDLPDGVYDAQVTVRTYHPLALLLSQE